VQHRSDIRLPCEGDVQERLGRRPLVALSRQSP
jgi:hypothetical protein